MINGIIRIFFVDDEERVMKQGDRVGSGCRRKKKKKHAENANCFANLDSFFAIGDVLCDLLSCHRLLSNLHGHTHENLRRMNMTDDRRRPARVEKRLNN